MEECVCVLINMRSLLWKAKSNDINAVMKCAMEQCQNADFFSLLLLQCCVIDVHVFKKMDFFANDSSLYA